MTHLGNCLYLGELDRHMGLTHYGRRKKSPQLLAAETPIGLKIFLAFVGVIAVSELRAWGSAEASVKRSYTPAYLPQK